MTKQDVLDTIYAIEDALDNGFILELDINSVMRMLTELTKLIAKIETKEQEN